jgi:uncharacterized OB-fold protein
MGRFEPPESEAGRPFWEATRRRSFELPWCKRCDKPFWYPREFCPSCLSPALEWRVASGAGVVYACSVMPKPAHPGMAERTPYTVALVELAEGPRLMTNIVGVDPDTVAVGMPVRLVWEELSDGRNLPVFEPSAEREER